MGRYVIRVCATWQPRKWGLSAGLWLQIKGGIWLLNCIQGGLLFLDFLFCKSSQGKVYKYWSGLNPWGRNMRGGGVGGLCCWMLLRVNKGVGLWFEHISKYVKYMSAPPPSHPPWPGKGPVWEINDVVALHCGYH